MLAVRSGCLKLSDCCVTGGVHGVHVEGEQAMLDLEGCKVSKAAASAVQIGGAGGAFLHSGTCLSENGTGVSVRGAGSHFSMEGCLMHSNHEDGLRWVLQL